MAVLGQHSLNTQAIHGLSWAGNGVNVSNKYGRGRDNDQYQLEVYLKYPISESTRLLH